VFFCTPHVVVNDLKTGRCEAEKVAALVIDECHRAQGGARPGGACTQGPGAAARPGPWGLVQQQPGSQVLCMCAPALLSPVALLLPP
jgi:hypothetical protein